MKHHSIENHIDNSILSKISDGLSLNEVVVVVLNNIKKFSERNCYMDVSKNYLLKNWKSIDIKRKYTTYYVIWSIKRSNDLDWLIKNKDRFPNLDNKKLFRVLKFKEKLLSSTF